MVRVKICGITSIADALTAQRAGADAVGFVFAKSPRRVSAPTARAIAKKLGPEILKVGVFVNASSAVVSRTAKYCGLDAVQLHGDETPAVVRALRAKGIVVIKAFRVKKAKDLVQTRRFTADAILLDTAVPGARGGTGQRFDWAILRKFRSKTPVIVSGGLNGRNVKELLGQYKPFGVDVSSGVERSPGVKNTKEMRKFVRHVKTSAK